MSKLFCGFFLLSFLQISTLLLPDLAPVVRYPWSKELTDDKEEPASCPIRKHKAPAVVEDTRPSHKGPIVNEPVVTERRGVRGSSRRIRGAGWKILSRHPTLALRDKLDVVPKSAATIQLPERKYSRPYYFICYYHFSSNTLVQEEEGRYSQSAFEEKNFTCHNSSNT
jgi:hypothetical protein